MSRIKHILLLLVSLYIVYIGGGVLWVDFCCPECEEMGMHAVETQGCHGHHHHKGECDHACSGECEITLQQLDIKSAPTTLQVVAPLVIDLFDHLPLLPQLILHEVEQERTFVATDTSPPWAFTSRFFLHLFSTLTI